MAIGGATFIAGQYTITWNGVALGIMRGDEQSPTIEYTSFGKAIENTDAFGRSTIDGIYQGGNFFAQYTCEEYKTGTIATVAPFGAGSLGVMGIIGRLWSDLAKPLVLTSIAGTPAAASPATLTASYALLAENYPVRLLFGPVLREVPIRQRLLPYASGGNYIWASST